MHAPEEVDVEQPPEPPARTPAPAGPDDDLDDLDDLFIGADIDGHRHASASAASSPPSVPRTGSGTTTPGTPRL